MTLLVWSGEEPLARVLRLVSMSQHKVTITITTEDAIVDASDISMEFDPPVGDAPTTVTHLASVIMKALIDSANDAGGGALVDAYGTKPLSKVIH